MELIKDYPALIIMGLWNNAVFNDDWIARNLLPGDQLTVEYPLHANGSMRITSPQFRIYTIDGRLAFHLLETTDPILDKVSDIARKVAEYLPHTPVTAFGYNLNFRLGLSEGTGLIPAIQATDSVLNIGKPTIVTAIKRIYNLETYQFTVEIVQTPENYVFNCNYHWNIKSLTEFITIIDEKSIKVMRDQAVEILHTLIETETAQHA